MPCPTGSSTNRLRWAKLPVWILLYFVFFQLVGLSKKYILNSYQLAYAQPFPKGVSQCSYRTVLTASLRCLRWGQHLLVRCQETCPLGTSRPLLLCLSLFLTGGPTPEAAWGSQSWGRSLCVSVQSELRQRGTYLHRSLRKRGQELQIGWFPLHNELVLCLEKRRERNAIMLGGQMVLFIVLEQRWKWCWYWGWGSRRAQPCRADLVPCWLGSNGVFNGWGQKIHNCIAGSTIVLVWA